MLEMSNAEVVAMFKARARRRFRHGVSQRYTALIQKLQASAKKCQVGEKPKAIKTHLRDAIIMPEMVGSIAAVYSGKYWNEVEIRADMIGDYLAEYSMTYKPVKHGKVGHGATRGSKFVAKT